MNKKNFDKLFMRYFWKILVMTGYLFIIITALILKAGKLEFAFFTVFYIAFTWQIFIERGMIDVNYDIQ